MYKPYRRIISISFLILLSTPTAYGKEETKNAAYTRDTSGRTYIFSHNPYWGELVFGAACMSLGHIMSLDRGGIIHFLKKTPEDDTPLMKLGVGAMIVLCELFGGYLVGNFLHARQQHHNPYIILDTHGIWCQGWETYITWRDITKIKIEKIQHYTWYDPIPIPVYHGFSWKIWIHTKQGVQNIDERHTRIYTGFRKSDPFEKERGELAKLITEYYRMYKS